jgi:UDP-2,3-diacylglucosamine pyrophosphatase LpxH
LAERAHTTVLIISDLHLGGEPGPGGAPGFRICTDVGERTLADFLGWAADLAGAGEVHLVVNGDVVDFLAEKEFSPFTMDDGEAREKLRRILARTGPVWNGFRALLKAGGRLTLLLGNHDIELSLPGPRRMLAEELGGGRFEFLYDNQALTIGPVLIEHGNRYDSWNVVAHDQLREVRSAMSRREPAPELPPPAGSRMVHEIMNALKARFPFVDLLKPENAGVVPILAVLDPTVVQRVAAIGRLAAAARTVRFEADGRPLDPRNIAAEPASRDRQMLRLAADLAAGGSAADIIAVPRVSDLWQRLTNAADAARRQAELDLLLRACRARAELHAFTFDTGKEDETYLAPARAASERGFTVVSYGHTHLAKRIRLGTAGATVYVNTGTWADLMRFPDAVFSPDTAAARSALGPFVDDLRFGRLEAYREHIPTFARIEVSGDRVESADLCVFGAADRILRVGPGRLSAMPVDPGGSPPS